MYPFLRITSGQMGLLWPLHIIADRLVYQKLRAALGNCQGPLVSGGGPLPAHVDEFFVVACLQPHLGLGGERFIEQCLDAV